MEDAYNGFNWIEKRRGEASDGIERKIAKDENTNTVIVIVTELERPSHMCALSVFCVSTSTCWMCTSTCVCCICTSTNRCCVYVV